MIRGGILKAGLAMAGIFIAGAVAGGFAGIKWQRHQTQQIDAREFTERHLRRVAHALELSAEQVDRIRPILMNEFADRIREVRTRSFNEMGQILREMNRRFEAELTPEQLTKHREFQEQMRERFQRETDRRGRRSDGDRNREWRNRDNSSDVKPDDEPVGEAPTP